jgi:hypothetical protein
MGSLVLLPSCIVSDGITSNASHSGIFSARAVAIFTELSIVAKVRALVLYISTYPVDATNEEGEEEINASRTGPV